MQFSRLRLVGFKSFADVTELLIEPGLTGLVGPNGCGKSNLAEALRWVMGESSYKTMRAARGEEVIFAGTAGGLGRAAANFAEAALYLDNSDYRAPLGFNSEAELVLSRHITRDGISQYRINGREARAKDVQFLLADQSTGAHSPAQVGQGRVGALIEAKPQARRILLEEAAGIGGLQLRRDAAEQQLARTDANLMRLREILADLAERLAALSAQAGQAAQFREFSAAIRRLEIMQHRLNLSENDKVRQKAETVLNRQTALLAEKHEAELKLGRKAEDLAAAAAAAQKAWEAAAAARQRLALEHQAKESERQLSRARAAAAEEMLARTERDIERERERATENGQIQQGQAAELAMLEAEAPPEDAGPNQAETAAQRSFEAAEKHLTAARAKRALSAAEWQAQENTARFYAELRVKQQQKLGRYDADIAAAAAARGGQDEDCAKAAENLRQAQADYAEQQQTAQAALARQKQRVADEAACVKEEAALLLALTAAQAGQQALRQTAAEFAAAHSAPAGNAAKALEPPVFQAANVETGYENAFAAAMGEALRASLNEAEPLYWRDMPPLREQALPPLPEGVSKLAAFVRAPRALSRALAQTGVVRSFADGAAMQVLLHQGQNLVSLAGDFWRWDGFSKKAGADADIYAGYVQRKQQLAELDRAAESCAAKHVAAAARLKQAAAAAAAANSAAGAAQQVLNAAQSRLSKAEETLRQAKITRDEGAAAYQRLISAQEADKAEAAELERQGAKLAGSGDAQAQMAAATAEEEQAEAAYKKARDLWLTEQAEIQARQKQAETKAARLKLLRQERSLWAERATAQEKYLAELEHSREAAAAENSALRQAEKIAAAAHEGLAVARAKAEREEADLAQVLAKAAEAQKTAARAAHKAEQETNAARETRSRADEKLAAALAGLRRAEEAAQAYWGRNLAPQDMEEDISGAELGQIELELRQIRRRREALGAVNLRAEEESAALAGRSAALKAEESDIAAAQAKLRQAIADLNREGRARLRKAFAEVNARFGDLFRRLFGGGAAELQWLEDEDPLNIGLEIIACPPGKKRQNLSLLSGGEQSLTALALIFAVFLSNPAPLCLLDEVDAPLDDYNVERFCRLLREMTNLTQTRFLVISHNPISMAHMDRLFGVTMAEKGVSTLVSVDLTEAAALIEADSNNGASKAGKEQRERQEG